MSFPTKPAFLHHGTWDDETRAHPCMKWMEQYTAAFDSRAYTTSPHSAWLTDDHVLVRSTGQETTGGAASWSALGQEIYAPFRKYTHVPVQLVTYETEEGWECFGIANLFWELAGEGGTGGGSGEKVKVKDGRGGEWDGMMPAAFVFRYRKVGEEGGFRLSGTRICADPTAAVVGMLKRGMMKAEDLVK